MPNLNRMSEDHKAVYDCLANVTLADVVAVLVHRQGGAINAAKFLGLADNANESQLLTAIEHRLGSLVDEALVTRSNGDRATAIYKPAR